MEAEVKTGERPCYWNTEHHQLHIIQASTPPPSEIGYEMILIVFVRDRMKVVWGQ